MGIFKRLNTVIKSNLNSLVDKTEDPEKLIAQTVQDMRDELKRAQRELVSTLGTAKRLEKDATELDDEVERWEHKAVLALKQNDEELAREALRRKAKTKAEAQKVRARANEQLVAAQQLKQALERVEDRIEDLDARKSTLAAQVARARQPAGASIMEGGGTFAELDRMAGRIDELDAQVEAHQVLEEPGRAEMDARFAALERGAGDIALEDELAALKSKLD